MYIKIYRQETVSNGYSTKEKLHIISSIKFRQWVSAEAKEIGIDNIRAVVTTQLPYCKWNVFRRRFHILALDCDGLESMFAAVWILKRDNIKWAGIESSPDHFWIIVDKIGIFSELFQILAAMPGTDNKYIEFVKKQKRFCLRATSRSTSKPNFGSSENLQDKRVIDWFESFQKLHEDPIIAENLGLIQHLKNGTMAGVAANPGFDV